MKEIGPNVIHKHGIKHISSFAQPKDVHIVEDNDCTSRGPTELPHNSSTEEAYCMPSFNLLDEELEESKRPSLKLVDEDSEEGSPAILIEDEDCKIITERTVFDHIRNKAKNLPVLATANNECSPSLQTLTLIRKRNREKQLELKSAIEIFEDTDENKISSKISHQSTASSSAEPKKVEQSRHCTDKDMIPNCGINSATNYTINDAGD